MSDEKIDDEQDDDSAGLPPSVAERLTKYAERTKRDLDDVMTEFFTYITKEHLCENWRDEDEDLLEDWAEQMLVETRNVSSGGGMPGLHHGCECCYRWRTSRSLHQGRWGVDSHH